MASGRRHKERNVNLDDDAVMLPLRLQCFKPVVAARQLGLCARAAFSTGTRSFADSSSSFTSPTGASQPAPRANFNPRPRTLSPGNERASQNLLSLIDRTAQRKERQRTQRTAAHAGGSSAEDLARHKMATKVTKQISRRWKTGDVYAPHDLSEVEMKKWKQRGKPAVDVFDVLELDPLVEYRNFAMLSEYMTPMGRIMHSNDTGLRSKNQRRIAKAIRRAVGMGFMPSVHRHPEILMKESTRRNEPLSRETKA
ncbi:hypothetical protein VE01_04395 [Pseudogymnoascus verrucosus]|uniref:Small ribosomal subunit protein bS18m n=1 Tax=Pseudogymnoascus verrucosus TaxID=342668 RepID=A0A1B8GNR8_9PEZI|nr:uncharacterized protein VE01_04395 [Pseudogymnoascus verrucosus]OBT97481.2 hypothetical protein VE01_04395 [Pseudogymnoascus verrucosus]